ncbi:MAG: hypothetical protein KTR29_20065 [Rhodothermaceae bacterium]|nr:hypothetical protein [Rhodothermaceae bacterium]
MNTRNLWLFSILLSLILCGLGLGELMIRRQTGASFYLLNKSLACTAILMITLSYVISAVHAFWDIPNKFLLYRRYTGLVGYGYAVLHIIASLFVKDPKAPLTNKFPFPDYFIDHPIAFLSALAGFGLFSYAFFLSIAPHRHNGTPQKARAWRKKLRYGYAGVLLICIHLVSLKLEGWITWLTTLSPTLPPLSLIAASTLTCLILLKILQLRKEKRVFETIK